MYHIGTSEASGDETRPSGSRPTISVAAPTEGAAGGAPGVRNRQHFSPSTDSLGSLAPFRAAESRTPVVDAPFVEEEIRSAKRRPRALATPLSAVLLIRDIEVVAPPPLPPPPPPPAPVQGAKQPPQPVLDAAAAKAKPIPPLIKPVYKPPPVLPKGDCSGTWPLPHKVPPNLKGTCRTKWHRPQQQAAQVAAASGAVVAEVRCFQRGRGAAVLCPRLLPGRSRGEATYHLSTSRLASFGRVLCVHRFSQRVRFRKRWQIPCRRPKNGRCTNCW